MNFRLLPLVCCAAAVSGCVLPDFHKVGAEVGNQRADAGVESDAGRPYGASADCRACIEDACSSALASCGPDCDDITFPITPFSPSNDKNAAFYGCLQQNCETACDVDWGCVNHYQWSQPNEEFTIMLRVNDLISSDTRIAGARVSACQGSDPACSEGAGLVAHGVTDASGSVSLSVPRSFYGYFLVQGPDSYAPLMAYWSQPMYWTNRSLTIPMILWSVADVLGSNTNTTVDHTASQLIFEDYNCLPFRLGGNSIANAYGDGVTVTFTPPRDDSGPVVYTNSGNMVDITLHSTSVSGGSYGGAINLPSQNVTVIGQRDGAEVTRAVLPMRPGTVGFVVLLPRDKH